MIYSDKCYLCNGIIHAHSFTSELRCDNKCSRVIIKTNEICLIVNIDIFDIFYSSNPPEFAFFVKGVTNSVVFASDNVPFDITNTYDLSEYLISFVTEIKKMKAFI